MDFELEAGDAGMAPAGFEHGSDGPDSEDFRIVVFNGTLPEDSHPPGHYHVEREGYIPELQLVRRPTDRYPDGRSNEHRG